MQLGVILVEQRAISNHVAYNCDSGGTSSSGFYAFAGDLCSSSSATRSGFIDDSSADLIAKIGLAMIGQAASDNAGSGVAIERTELVTRPLIVPVLSLGQNRRSSSHR